jgi:hypothetical protein
MHVASVPAWLATALQRVAALGLRHAAGYAAAVGIWAFVFRWRLQTYVDVLHRLEGKRGRFDAHGEGVSAAS